MPFEKPLSVDQHELTRFRILETIRSSNGIARKDIAQKLETSAATVTSVTAEMLSAGIIEEVPSDSMAQEARRGRPRVYLKLLAYSHTVAGVKIGRNIISILIANFAGEELSTYTAPLENAFMSPEEFIEELSKALHAACQSYGMNIDALSAVSIGLAGQIDPTRNFIHWSSSLNKRNVDLGPSLESRFPFPVFVENDANMVAKAEQLFGAGRKTRNFLVVTIEHGIGLGVIINGELYRGERGCGAEFGHTKLHLEGALCQCGQRGCLEAYAGSYSLIREASTANPKDAPKTVEEIIERSEEGDPVATAILDRAGQMFGMGMANLINLFDPQLIIFSGTLKRFDHLHSEKVMAQIKRNVVQVDAPLPEIHVQQWGEEMWAKGAAAHAIEQVSILRIKELATYAA